MSYKPDRRFEVIQAPDDRWMIFDRTTGGPAEPDGCVLIGLDRRTALSIKRYLKGTDMPLKVSPRPAKGDPRGLDHPS